jgi:hypothetical protein
MLWAAGGIAIIGLLAGFTLYNQNAPLQFNNPPSAPTTTATDTAPATNERVLVSEAEAATPPAPSSTPPSTLATQVLGQSTACQTTARDQAMTTRDTRLKAEDERYQSLMSKRSGVKQFLSAITGGIASPPSQEEVDKHDTLIKQINQTYASALDAANCPR